MSDGAREDFILDKIDSCWDRLDLIPETHTTRIELEAHARAGTLGGIFRAMAEIEWERQS